MLRSDKTPLLALPSRFINIKTLVFSLLFLFSLLLFTCFALLKSHQNPASIQTVQSFPSPSSCNCTKSRTGKKIEPFLAQALIHYATSNATPQQTLAEISVTAAVLAERSPCNFLVFGLGLDSPLWAALNAGGRTAFLEEDTAWIAKVTAANPTLEAYHVDYGGASVTDAERLLAAARADSACRRVVADPRESQCLLAHRGFPAEVYAAEWEVVMVDAPTGYHGGAPGRMTAIYTAGLMARGREAGARTEVMVHDVDRAVEDTFSREFLCEGYLKEEVGRLRHFSIPSHRARLGIPFCPYNQSHPS